MLLSSSVITSILNVCGLLFGQNSISLFHFIYTVVLKFTCVNINYMLMNFNLKVLDVFWKHCFGSGWKFKVGVSKSSRTWLKMWPISHTGDIMNHKCISVMIISLWDRFVLNLDLLYRCLEKFPVNRYSLFLSRIFSFCSYIGLHYKISLFACYRSTYDSSTLGTQHRKQPEWGYGHRRSVLCYLLSWY